MKNSKPRLLLFLAILALIGIVVFAIAPDEVFARAGGGGGFGGGSSSSGGGGGFGGGGGSWGGGGYSSGGGSSSGEGDPVLALVIFAIAVVVVLIFHLLKESATSGTQHVAREIHKAVEVQHTSAKTGALSELRSRDPNFNEAAFLERISRAFVKIQQAWSRQDLSSVWAFISDGIHERFSLQIEMQKAEGFRNQMQNVRVLGPEIVAVYSDDHFDTIHVQIPASAVDYNVDLKTGRRISGSDAPQYFTEFWSFHRRHGATTVAKPGSIEGNCPSCGAPLKIVDRAVCESCSSNVNSGEHDWVLAEITQTQEWRLPDPNRRVRGLAKLQENDPGFSVQHIEDRVSVMFYRLKAASFFRNEGYAAPILAKSAGGIPRAERLNENEYWNDPVIGKVEVLQAESGPPETEDRVYVLVRWSGARTRRGQVLSGRKAIYSQVYVLVRRRGVRSRASQTFASLSCGKCGAPIAVTKEPDCKYCGTSLVDGKHDWVLEDITRYTHDMAFRRPLEQDAAAANGAHFAEPLIPGDAELSLAILSRIVWVDGRAGDDERKALCRIGVRWGLGDSQIEAALNSGSQKDIDLPIPENREEADTYLKQLISVSLADGRLTQSEIKMLYHFGNRMDYEKSEINRAVKDERKEMYARARELRKQGRNGTRIRT